MSIDDSGNVFSELTLGVWVIIVLGICILVFICSIDFRLVMRNGIHNKTVCTLCAHLFHQLTDRAVHHGFILQDSKVWQGNYHTFLSYFFVRLVNKHVYIIVGILES